MIGFIVGAISFVVFSFFQTLYISAGDSGDLVTAAVTFGVAHPPGYPLYTFLGWLLNHLTIFTSVWRITLLSSIPHALVIAIVYAIVWRITKNRIASLVSCIVLTGNYIFFLYSISPEVFALLDLFIILVFWCAWSWKRTNKDIYAYLGGLCIGLSLAHHHMILFAAPSYIYLLYADRKRFMREISLWWFFFFVLLGFSAYVYVPFAARGMSIINWDTATTVPNFIQLLTRADYGTFQSGAVLGQLPLQRFLQLKAYAQYVLMDFTWFGIVLLIAGLYSLWKTEKILFRFISASLLFLGLVFFFYASFPLTGRFTLGTYERFLLPSYVFIALVIGIGVSSIQSKIRALQIRDTPVSVVASSGFALVLCIVFGLKLYATTLQFQGIRTDRTAQNLAYDILHPLPQGSMVLLNRDTPLFTTQFVRYGLGIRPDVIVLHTNKIGTTQYTETMKRVFPSLTYPQAAGQNFVTQFLQENSKSRRIYSNAKIPLPPSYYWVPFGLVYELTSESNLPTVMDLYERNLRIWSSLHSPQNGILGRFNHLMLSDVRDIYTDQRFDFGKTLLKSNEFVKAREQFAMSISYGGDLKLGEAYVYKGVSEMFSGECMNALSDFDRGQEVARSKNREILYYKAATYRDCLKDATKSSQLFDEYKAQLDTNETRLQSL